LPWSATLTAPLVATLLVAPAAHIASPTRSAPAPAPRAIAPEAPATGSAGHASFEKVANILARRYRVSSQATLDLVRTAYREANRNGLDPLLILAVVAIESSFNPIAQSDAGAMGLMQIVPRFHEDKLASRRESVLDPRVNIEVGTQVLREYIRRAGTETAGLQLYNGSPDDPAAAYANKVMSERDRLRQAIKRGEGNRA
jgi:soluble lytic murein transglycosylase-like protein